MRHMRSWNVSAGSLALLLAASCAATSTGGGASEDPMEMSEGIVISSDGIPIHYYAGGRGDPALVFVHGWLGNAAWWENQIERFKRTHRVVALDLAGHGGSGRGRIDWTVERFADDVVSVVKGLGLRRVILLGHSMSGAITVEAARRMPERVVALVPVDTLQDVEWDLPQEVWQEFFGGLRRDFPGSVEGFFRTMLAAPASPAYVLDYLVGEARSADPALAVPMLERAREYDLRGALRSLRAPIHAINSDANETRLEVNRKYAPRFDVTLVKGVGHWPMLEDPAGFGAALEQVLAALGSGAS